MIRIKKYFNTTLISLIFSLGFGYQSFCQIDTTKYPKESIVYRKYINFHVNDSIIPFTLFVENKFFYFRNGFVTNPEETEVKFVNQKSYVTSYPLITDTILNIYSCFPKLISKDYTTNKSGFDTIKLLLGSNWAELDNSYLLHGFREPSLYFCSDIHTIRIIYMLDATTYRFVRIEFDTNYIRINCSNAELNADATFRLSLNKSCSIHRNNDNGLEEGIHNIRFNSEPYYSNLNLSKHFPTDRVILEYRDGSKYYVLQKPKFEKQYRKLVRMIEKFTSKCKVKNSA